jgi:hypothetical protein
MSLNLLRGVVVCSVVALSACSGSSPAAPTPPPVPACQANNTADLTLENGSPNSFTFDVLIDNISRGTMAPGGHVGPLTLSAGIDHVIVSRITNTTVVGCSSNTSFAACSTQTLTCRH